MKRAMWFQTDLGYEATIKKLEISNQVASGYESKGRFTFQLKGLKDITFQITKNGKLGIFLSEGINEAFALDKVRPYLVKPDGSEAKITKKIFDSKDQKSEDLRNISKNRFGFFDWLRYRSEKKRLEESRIFKPKALPLIKSIYQNYKLEFLKPFIEHDEEINRKFEELFKRKD